MKIAVVGAGICGSLIARELHRQGHDVCVLEKSRGRGGRVSHKRTDWGEFDLGAPVIPASNDDFIAFMQAQVVEGLAHHWPIAAYDLEDSRLTMLSESLNFVFSPCMNSACYRWLSGIELKFSAKIRHLQKTRQGWLLWDDENRKFGAFDRVILTAPWPQTKALLEEQADSLSDLPAQEWSAAWSTAFSLSRPLNTPAELIYCQQGPLQTLVHDAAKPARDQSSSFNQNLWVAYHQNSPSDPDYHKSSETLLHDILGTLQRIDETVTREDIQHHYAHRWLYARPARGAESLGVITAGQSGLFAAGDWSVGASVQAAFEASRRCLREVERTF